MCLLKIVTYENSWVWKQANDMYTASDRGDRCPFVFNFNTILGKTYCHFHLFLPTFQALATYYAICC